MRKLPIIDPRVRDITIDNFDNAYWLEGFESEVKAGQRLLSLRTHIAKGKQKGETGVTNLGLIKRFCERTLSNQLYAYAIDDSGYIYRDVAPWNGWTQLRDIVPTASSNPGIKPFTVSGIETLLYTSARYLCRTDNDTDFTENIDLGAEQSTWYRQIEILAETALIGNGNWLASYSNVGVLTQQKKQLPNGYMFRCMATNGDNELISATKNETGALLLWNGVDEWSSIKWRKNPVTAICPHKNGWIFGEGNRLFVTDGYSIKEVPNGIIPGSENQIGNLITSILATEDRIIVGVRSGLLARAKAGVWIYLIKKQNWQFLPSAISSSAYTYCENLIGSIYFSSDIDRYLIGYRVSDIIPNRTFISQIYLGPPKRGTVIFPFIPIGRKVNLEHLIVNFLPYLPNCYSHKSPSLDITLRICDNKRVFWGYGQSNAAGTEKNKIQVNGTLTQANNAQIGDEVLVLEGLNGGCRRKITVIANQGMATEMWTLDSNLNENIEYACKFNILPFKTIETKSLTDYSVNRVKFDLSDIEISARALIEIEIKGAGTYPISISSVIFKPSEIEQE